MSRVFLSAAIGASALASGCLAGAGEAAAPPRLEDERVGWSVAVPTGWRVGRAVAATAFAAGARCRSTYIVDRAEPGGPGPSVSRSFVQVCARPIRDGRTIRSFIAATYGTAADAQFAPATFGGHHAYRSRRSDPALVFLQTSVHRIQVATSVTRDPARRELRRAQADRILRSFELRRDSG